MTTPRDDIAGRETHTVHDPFLKRDVEVSSKLTDRLRGKYAKGPTMPDGEPEFGWSQFETPPIQHEAADAIDALQARVKELESGIAHAQYRSDNCDAENQSLYNRLEAVESRALRAEQERDVFETQLPDGMKHCTITFHECEKGHGWLSATNWIDNGCLCCQRDEAYERAAESQRALWFVLDANDGFTLEPADMESYPGDDRAEIVTTRNNCDGSISLKAAIRRLAGPEKEKKE